MKFSWPLLSLLSCVCLAQDNTPDPKNFFIQPPKSGPKKLANNTVYSQNPTYAQNSAEKLVWETNVTAIDLILFQEGPGADGDTPYLLTLTEDNDKGEYYWNGSIGDIVLEKGTVFFLAAYDNDTSNSSPLFYSHYFNITKDNSTVSSTISSATSSRSSLLTSTSEPTTTTVDSATASPSEATATGPSSTAAAAVVGNIGNGVGGTVFAVVAAFLFW